MAPSISKEENWEAKFGPGGNLKKNQLRTLETVRKNYDPGETRRMMKNLIMIGIPFVLLFGSFFSVASIQSSLHGKSGLGPYSLATIYIVGSATSLFFLSFILSKITCKSAMVVAMVGYIIYMLAQFYPMFLTLIPAGALQGVGGGVLWTGMSNYVSQMSSEYSYLTGEDVGGVLAKFFGIFFLMYQMSLIWGNVSLAFIFSMGDTPMNFTANDSAICGPNFCPASSVDLPGNVSVLDDPATNLPPQSTLNLLFGFYFGCMLLGAFIMQFCVDPLSRYGEGCIGVIKRRPGVKDLLLATLKQMRDPYQLLLIPIIFFSTFQTGFFAIDFTAGYITCTLGMEQIGKILICFGLAAATSSLIFSRIIKYTGRLTVFLIIITVHLAADLFMLTWIPVSSQPIPFYVIAAMYGTVEGVLSPQITAFLALFFPDNKEAAFNNCRLWQGLGYITAYVNATAFCITVKLYLIMVVATVSFIGYSIVEILYTKKCKREVGSPKC